MQLIEFSVFRNRFKRVQVRITQQACGRLMSFNGTMPKCVILFFSNPEKSDLLIWEDGDDKGLVILISDFRIRKSTRTELVCTEYCNRIWDKQYKKSNTL